METNRQNHIRRIAERIDDLMYSFDVDDYNELAESETDPHESNIQGIYYDIVNGKTDDIMGHLDAIIGNGTDKDAEEARTLISEINGLFVQKTPHTVSFRIKSSENIKQREDERMATFLGVDVTKKAVYKDNDKVREKFPAKKVKERADYHKKKYSIGSLYVSGSIYDVNGKLDDSCRFAKITEDNGLSAVSVMEYEKFGRKETGSATYQYADFDKSYTIADPSAAALFTEGERLRKEAESKIKSEYVEPVAETDDDFEKGELK